MTLLSSLVWDAYSLYREMEETRPGTTANGILSSFASTLNLLTEKSSRLKHLYQLHHKDDDETKLAAGILSTLQMTQKEVQQRQEEMRKAGAGAPGPSKLLCVMTILNNCALLSGGHIELAAAQNALNTQLMIFEVCFKDNSQKAIFIDRVNDYLQTIWDKKVADKIAAECLTLRQENKSLQDENQQLKTRAVPTLSPSTVPVSSPLLPESDDEEKNNRRMRVLQANEIKALHSELKKKDAEIEAKEAELSKLRVALDFKTRMLDSNTHELNLFRRQAVANNQPMNPASVAPVLPARKN